MNLMFETAIREAKPLPSFAGSDEYFVNLTLDGRVIDSKMLALMKKMDEERLDAITIDDFLLISKFYTKKDILDLRRHQFEHLMELGIVEQTELGLQLVNSGITFLIDSIPQATTQVTTQDTTQDATQDNRIFEIIEFCSIPRTRGEIQHFAGISGREDFRRRILKPLLESGKIRMTIPDKPSSGKQKYIRT
jgi:hypothetical protein